MVWVFPMTVVAFFVQCLTFDEVNLLTAKRCQSAKSIVFAVFKQRSRIYK